MNGDSGQRIEDPKVAHEEGLTINALIDEKGIKKNRSKFAEEQSTDALTRQAEKTVESQYDERTGLPNYLLFRDNIKAAMQQAFRLNNGGKIVNYYQELLEGINILVLDIGFLGYANDNYGQSYGDDYKNRTAQAIKNTSSKFASSNGAEAIVYAMSRGDEFVVLSDMSGQDLQKLSDQVKKEMLKLEIAPGSRLPASVGTGTACAKDYFRQFIAFEAATYADHNGMYDRFLFVLESLADLGHQLDKNEQRLKLLNAFLQNPAQFGVQGEGQSDEALKLRGYILKNSIGIKDDELSNLANDTSRGTEKGHAIQPPDAVFKERARRYITEVQKKRLQNELARATDPLNRLVKELQLKMIEDNI